LISHKEKNFNISFEKIKKDAQWTQRKVGGWEDGKIRNWDKKG
jgi:hypothetical protein